MTEMISPYLKRPRRRLEDVLQARYDKLRRAIDRLGGQARMLSPEEAGKLARLEAEIAALERELRGSNQS